MSDILMEKKEVRAIMWECVEKHADSLDDGVEAALSKVKKLDCFEELSDLFCSKFLRVSMGGMRHEINMEIKRAAGGFYAPAKVNPAKSKIMQKIFRNAMQYQINGTILGKLRGEQLLGLAAGMEKQAGGYLFNATLLRDVAKHVKGVKTVEQSLSVKKLQKIFDKVSDGSVK